MTKSQNTKNEQNCIKQNEKSFIQKDLSLTELWQKGELPSGEYYIIDDLGLHTTDRYYPSHGFGAELPQSVLGRVPSYEEWRAKLEENKLLKKFCEEFNALNVSKENEKLKEEVSRESYKVSEAYCFVEELKELLKQSRIYVKIDTEDYDDRAVSKTDKDEAKKLLTKIDEVLK